MDPRTGYSGWEIESPAAYSRRVFDDPAPQFELLFDPPAHDVTQPENILIREAVVDEKALLPPLDESELV